jgi:hypothetical protein
MKKNIFFICFILILSCHQKPREMDCNELIEESFNGKAAIFFHKPISGSTYQIFLFPLCNVGFDNKLEEPSYWTNLRKGISFNLTSDDPQFKTLYNNSRIKNLKGRDQMAENFRSIYYCFAKVEVLCDQDGTKSVEESKKLILESSSVILKFHFISYVNFKIVDSLPNWR